MFYIYKTISTSAIDYAAEELKKYLRMMMPEGGDVKIAYNPDAADGFRLGLMQDFGLDVSDAENTELDDIIYIDCDEKGGIIAGSNPRSVLLSVYEYFRQMGCRWLFPGVDGEYIPMKDITPVKYRHKPTDRYRGNCIEGAVSQRIITDYIDFMPKLGLNTFMIQFKVPGAFYNRYYDHKDTDGTYPPESVSEKTIIQWTRLTECEMAKRGLMLHSYGHGFTADPFGVTSSCSGWGKFDISVFPEDKRCYIAEMGGVRDLNNGALVNTNFCMSNADARREVVNYIADYCENHSNIDYLHVWLADSRNNHCECAECRKKRPSDFYVMLMNEADEELTKRDLNTRIVFISYVDTSWAPLTEKINNPDRFTLMIAPITRDYKKTLNGDEKPVALPYERNKLTMPKDLAEYLAYFDEWRKSWGGANVCFEYHFWVHSHYDISGLRIAERIYEDVKLYRARGFDGVIQCGTQRSFFPSGYAFYVHARSMFDEGLSLSEITEDYFSHIYGEDWEKFYALLRSLDEALPFEFFSRARYSESIYDNELAKKIAKIPEITATVGRTLIDSHYNSDVRVRTVAVRLLEKYLRYATLVADVASAKARGLSDLAEKNFEIFAKEFAEMEREILPYADVFQNTVTVRQLLKCETPKEAVFVLE